MNMVAVFDEIIRHKPAASEWLAWACLMRQTLCFGKAEDDLADSRLEKLTGLRRDRARAAVRTVVDMGLFDHAGKGKYGTLYRIPQRFLGDDGYIGFSSNIGANIGASETDAYADISADEAETNTPEHGEAYQKLVETNRMLVDANQVLVNTNQKLVETNQVLVNALPSFGEQLTKTRLNAYQELVTDINKPKHTKTTTTLNLDSEEPYPERWPEHWDRLVGGGNDFQAWEQYAAAANEQPAHTAVPESTLPAKRSIPASTASGITAEALQYPAALTADELADAPKKLDGLHPQIAQEVLDALAWKMANGEVKKSNIGLLVWLANSARTGAFDRTPALEWRKQQQEQQGKLAKVTVTELNNLANEIKALQAIYKAGGIDNSALLGQIEKMKTDYFEKVSNHEKQEGVCTQM